MSHDNQPGVVQLPSAGIPADQGLSSLGLIMQLGGSLLAAGVALMSFMALVAMSGPGESLWMFLLLGTCITRSLFHRMAGTELLYGRRTGLSLDGTATSPLRGLHRYIIVGLIHTVVFTVILKLKFDVPSNLLFGLALGLLAWPATLGALLYSNIFKRFVSSPGNQIPVSEDKGFEGAAILMTVLGVCGVLATGTILLAMFESGGRAMQEGRVLLVMLALVMLVVRSCLHVQAGISGLRTTSVDRSVELANRYANFGVISAFCAGGALLLVAMTSRLDLSGLAGVTGAVWMLMAWPMIIRRFFSDRQFADLLAGDNATLHRRSPDAGLTGLGWLLLAHAVFGASFLLPELVGVGELPSGMGKLFDLLGSVGERSPWWSAGVIMMEAWAGYELIRMSAHHRVIATIYAAVAAAVTLYLFWPVLDQFKQSSVSSPQHMLVLMPIAIALVIPTSVLILVNRKIAPTARARFRSRPKP